MATIDNCIEFTGSRLLDVEKANRRRWVRNMQPMAKVRVRKSMLFGYVQVKVKIRMSRLRRSDVFEKDDR